MILEKESLQHLIRRKIEFSKNTDISNVTLTSSDTIERIQNDLNSEFDEAKKQVMKIASFRFKDIASI